MLIINFVSFLVVIYGPILTLTSAFATTVTFVLRALLRGVEISFFCITRVVAFCIWRWFCWRTLACAFTASLAHFFAALLRRIEDSFSSITGAFALFFILHRTFRTRAAGKPSAF